MLVVTLLFNLLHYIQFSLEAIKQGIFVSKSLKLGMQNACQLIRVGMTLQFGRHAPVICWSKLPPPPRAEPQPPCVLFSEFQEVSTEDVKKILSKRKLKSCDLDPLPAAILKQCLDILLPVIRGAHSNFVWGGVSMFWTDWMYTGCSYSG